MKRLLTILGLLVLFAGVLRAQDCPFNVKYNVIAATCHNNGKIAYALTDNSGNVYTTLPAELTDVRMYYKVSASDSAHYSNHYYTGGWDTMVVTPQEYNTIGVEGLCTGASGPQMLHKEFKNVRVNGSYTPLTASYRLVDGSNKANTLECLDAGSVYFNARYGRYPYKLVAEDATSNVVVKTKIHKNNGEQDQRNNELIIEELPSGIYLIKVEDACGTTVSLGNVEIESMPVPQLQHIGVPSTTFDNSQYEYTYGGTHYDSNIVRLAVVFDEAEKAIFQQMNEIAEYRFTYDGFQSNGWKPLNYRISFVNKNFYPNTGTLQNVIDVRDTVLGMRKYSELWGKDITFEYRLTSCGTQTFTHTFQILPPDETQFKPTTNTRTSQSISYKGCEVIRERYTMCTVQYNDLNYQPSTRLGGGHITRIYNKDEVDIKSRHYYTLPLVITFSDTLTGYVIRKDTIDRLLGYYYLSTVYDTTLRRIYGLDESEHTVYMKVRVEDAKGCELSQNIYQYKLYPKENEKALSFTTTTDNDANLRCSSNYFTIYPDYDYGAIIVDTFRFQDGTKIRLVESPRGNFYNFDALWDSVSQELTLNKDNADNLIDVSIEENYNGCQLINMGHYFSFNEDTSSFSSTPYNKTLHPGRYKFEIDMPMCGEAFKVTAYVRDTIKRSERLLSHEIDIQKQCYGHSVTLTSGLDRQYVYSHINDGTLKVDTIDVPLSMRVYDGPSGQYETKSVGMNEPISLFGIGRYRLILNNSSCESYLFDTVEIVSGTIIFEESSAILCDTTSTSGDVLLAVSNGVEPLTYELHSGNDITGPLLGTNNDGIFRNLPMTLDSVFTAKVTDDCGHSIIVNIHPLALSNTRKAWFDGGLDSTAICEGNTIGINALGKGVLYHYTWTGPNGFVSNSHKSTVVVNKGSESGWYKVEISNTGCPYPIVDSIYLTVLKSPYIELTQGIAECFDNDTIINFTAVSPNNSNNIYFNYIYADNTNKRLDGKNNIRLSNGETLSDTVRNLTNFSKVFFTQVRDGVCTSSSPTDTMNISVITPIPVTITTTCPSDVEKALKVGECNFKVEETTLDEATATHSLGWALEINAQLPADSMLAAGENTVMWIATDRCGNADTCTQKVAVTFPECPTVTDADGNTYESVRIGCDCWMQRNLESSTYADNSPISWAKGYESFMHPDADANIAVFGRLYDFASAVKDSADNGHGHVQGACPDGWHLPTPAQYSALLGMDATTLKTSEYWIDGGGNNSTGFSWLPAGRYNGAATRFEGLLASSWFWSVDGTGENLKVYSFCTRYSCDTVMEDSPANGSAYSIRCVKEKE